MWYIFENEMTNTNTNTKTNIYNDKYKNNRQTYIVICMFLERRWQNESDYPEYAEYAEYEKYAEYAEYAEHA